MTTGQPDLEDKICEFHNRIQKLKAEIGEHIAEGRERDLVLTKLEEAELWLAAALANSMPRQDPA
jgi:hypothetical protein